MCRNESHTTLAKKVLILISIFLILSVPSSLVYAEWTNVSPPNVSSDWELFGVHLISANEGWAVGEDFTNNTGVLLHLAGESWSSIASPNPSLDWGLRGVNLISANEGWAVGMDSINKGGIILHLLNGSWTSSLPPSVSLDWELSGVHFTSSSQGWAVGKDSINKRGVILRFLNGSWISFFTPNVSSDWELSGIHLTSSTEGWAVGKDSTNKRGVILHFSNALWTSFLTPNVSSDWELVALHLTSSTEGWAVGKDSANKKGVLLHFLNGSWTSVSPPDVSSDWELVALHLTSFTEGWAVGQDFSNKKGVLIHSQNGSWTSVSPPNVTSDWELRGVYLISSDHGWAVGRGSDGTNVKGVLLSYSVPTISVSPKSVKYLEVAIGAVKDQTVTVKNNGNAGLIIGTITSPALPFIKKTDNCSDKTIAPQNSCKLIYRFDPTSEGTFASNSNIPSNDPSADLVTVTLSGSGILGPPLFINLLSPPNAESFDACAYYNPPTFQWDPSEAFKSSEVQFSLQNDFSVIPLKVKGKKGASALLIPSSSWKKALLLPGESGGTVYWRVVGTRADKSQVESNVFSLVVKGSEFVSNPMISSTSKTTPPLPTLSWENNCNIKFKAWFGDDPDFTKHGMKKTALSFNIKNPNDNGGQFTKELTSSQWKAIRKVVHDVSGPFIYWYVESWDALNRSAKTGVTSFVLTD